jgi:DNA polymerase/3'-5' exonuclease PolX
VSAAIADTRMDRPVAIEIAKAFVAEIEGTYDQLVVAGSLRRRLARIGDIEVVAVPKVEPCDGGLFGDRRTEVDMLDLCMADMLEHGEVGRRLDKNGSPRWGPTLKYLTFRDTRVDLFTPCAERFGWILALRTGPAAFSRQLVVERGRRTKDGRPGLLPPRLLPRDGWLTSRLSAERIETPTERSVFELFGVPYSEPWERT